jgi:MbtH protein
MTNPFDDPDGSYYTLINDEGQYSLWPAFADIPAGWRVEWGPDSRETCLRHVEENWTDMRPLSLIRHMDSIQQRPEPQ